MTETPGSGPGQALRRRILSTALALNATGLSPGKSGNVSARHDTGMLVTPSGMPYDRLTPEDIVFVGLDGTVPPGQRLPSSEWHFHLAIYRARPDAGAVVHAHSLNATALACLRCEIPAFHYMVAVAGGSSIRCADYATFGTEELATNALAALDERKACLLGNHGQIALGPDLDAALDLAREVEALAAQYRAALQVGEPVLLDEAEMARVLEKFKTYGKQPDTADFSRSA